MTLVGSTVAQPLFEPAVARPLYSTYIGEAGVEIASPLGIGYDLRRNEVLLANTQAHRIEVYDQGGRPRGGFVHRVARGDSIVAGLPVGVAVDAEGHFLVVDRFDPCVDVVDFFGRSITRLCLPADSADAAGSAQDLVAGSVAVAPDGTIFVANSSGRGRIYRFDAKHRFQGSWGVAGGGPGQLSMITGMAFTASGDLLVIANGTELCVQRFNTDGTYVSGFGRHEVGPGNFSFPNGIAVTADGRIWVTDAIRQNLQVFDSEGTYVGAIGGAPSTRPGEFMFPSGVATDGGSRLVVSERVGQRFQMFETLVSNDSRTSAPERR